MRRGKTTPTPTVVNGFHVGLLEHWPQVWVVKGRRGRERHFTTTITNGDTVETLCVASLKRPKYLEPLFPLEPGTKEVDCRHAKDFCQGCVKSLRDKFGIYFTHGLMTVTLRNRERSLPNRERRMLFYANEREEHVKGISAAR